jgi:hypothetical protein
MYLRSSRVARVLYWIYGVKMLLTCFIVGLIGVESEQMDFDDSHRHTKQVVIIHMPIPPTLKYSYRTPTP